VIADRLVDAIISDQISPEDKAFIERAEYVFSSPLLIRKGALTVPTKVASIGLVKVIE